jgi:hypothetical protein
MSMMLDRRNDERIDALAREVDDLRSQAGGPFEQISLRLDRVEAELREQREAITVGLERVSEQRFEHMQWLFSQTVIVACGLLVLGFIALGGLRLATA